MDFNLILSVLIGIGLASACGFRVFVPFAILSIASLAGVIDLSSNFTWIGTYPALIAFIIATVMEILAYYIPYVDNLLDTIEAPLSFISGIILMLSILPSDISPIIKWSLSVIAGGPVATSTQLFTAFIRGTSVTVTGGLLNFLINTVEIILSIIVSIVVILLPLVSLFVVGTMIIIYIRKKNKGSRISAS